MTPKEVLEFAKSKGLEMVDLRFMDFIGTWQHFAVPIYELKEDSFEEGFGFDGSSIRGFKRIEQSDMYFLPDPATYALLPWRGTDTARTARLICDVHHPDGKPYPHHVRRALRILREQDLEIDVGGGAFERHRDAIRLGPLLVVGDVLGACEVEFDAVLAAEEDLLRL